MLPDEIQNLVNIEIFNYNNNPISSQSEIVKKWLEQTDTTLDYELNWISLIFCENCMQIKPKKNCPRCNRD